MGLARKTLRLTPPSGEKSFLEVDQSSTSPQIFDTLKAKHTFVDSVKNA
jgi:hypothetical protein